MYLSVDFTRTLGPIRAMHAVGQPPYLSPKTDRLHYLTEAHIPYARLHDMGGGFGANLYVDIPNLFRDFDADENDPASYDFTFTDDLITKMMAAKCPPIFRLGVTIENHRRLKVYRIDPPKDFAKWARICEHVVRHYNEGWADGFTYGIQYWEIWNEPDNSGPDPERNEMWTGTPQQYYDLYEITAKHLKACFGDSIKVGGFASCGFYAIHDEPERYGFSFPAKKRSDDSRQRNCYFIDFNEGFLAHVKRTGAPLDFYSWHSYASVTETTQMADYIDGVLTRYGFGEVETQLNEWNNAHQREYWGTSYASAQLAAMILAFQRKKTDILCYYDARIGTSPYGGLFNPMTLMPVAAYYSLKAFGELYALGTEAACHGFGDGVYAIAAKGEAGEAVMIANIGEDVEITTNLTGMKAYQIDAEHFMTEGELDPTAFTLTKNTVVLLKR